MSDAQQPANGVSAKQVADYLASHPDFFNDHQTLLEVLHVPHDSGPATSLVERQATMLRDRNQQLTINLSDLLEIARHNDMQLQKTERMVLSLLDALTLDELMVALEESLCQDFAGDHIAVLLFNDRSLDVNNLRVLPRDTAGVIGPLIKSNFPTCGQLQPIENRFLFTDNAPEVGSAAVVPLVKGETIGVLAIGSTNPSYFHSSLGTMFLSYVGEVLSRVVSRILHEELS